MRDSRHAPDMIPSKPTDFRTGRVDQLSIAEEIVDNGW
jgi:hypothetical protein